MSQPTTPAEVFRAQLDTIHGRRAEAYRLYAVDAVVRHMFGSQHTWHGNEELREHFGRINLPVEDLTAKDVVVHETTDPEVVLGEFRYAGRRTGTGEPFTMNNILVMRVRDGKIVESRDYHDTAKLAELAT